jgi:hypothetical protein
MKTTPSTISFRKPPLESLVASAMVLAVVIGGLVLSPTVQETTQALTRADALPEMSAILPSWPLERLSLSLLADASTN